MPINPKLKEQLEKAQMDEAYRTKLIQTLEDAPADVQNLWMTREDYTRQVNAFKTEQTEWKTKADKFYSDSNAAIDSWKSEVKKAQDAVTAANARIAELESGSGFRTPGQDDAALKEIAGLKTLITQLEAKLPQNVVTTEVLNNELGKAYQSAVGFLGEQNIKLRAIEKRHESVFGANTFGEKETEELIVFANEQSQKEGRRVSLDDAYKMKYGTDLQKRHDEEVARKAVEADRSTRQVPVGSGPAGPGVSEKGPLQIRLEELSNRDSGAKDGGGYRDWKEAAAAAADELVKEGKY